jgi:hypothetical protein
MHASPISWIVDRVHSRDVHPIYRRTDLVPHGLVRVLQPQLALQRLLRAPLWCVICYKQVFFS